jgi:hypothetical protein
VVVCVRKEPALRAPAISLFDLKQFESEIISRGSRIMNHHASMNRIYRLVWSQVSSAWIPFQVHTLPSTG